MGEAEDKELRAADERVARALEESEQSEETAPEDPALAEERVVACLKANHANTLALVACLKACDVAEDAPRPYREVEEGLVGDPALALSTQTPHTLIGLLVKAGGIERTEVPQAVGAPTGEGAPADSAAAPADSADPAPAAAPASAPQAADPAGTPQVVDAVAPTDPAGAPQADAPADAPQPAAPADQPVDYVLRTTDAGRAALAAFDPVVRFSELVASEPDGYLDAYARVLDACSDASGASRAAVEQALADHPALVTPKRVYPGYFISKLETVGGLSWDGAWHVTEAGERMLASFA